MFHEIYPIPVYNTKLDNHLQVQKDFEEVVKDDSNFKQNSGWHCNVDTTFGLVDANSLPFK
jgi:paraquat-inducible protein B